MRDDLLTAVLRRTPEHLTPANPGVIVDAIHAAVTNGWTPEQLVDAALKDCGQKAGPGSYVMALRRIAGTPVPSTPSARRRSPHGPCRDATHPPACQTCYCLPGMPDHVVPTRAPVWFTGMREALFAATRLPE